MSRWQWTKLVKRIVERDKTCQLRLPGCTHQAETADHIVARVNGGSNKDDNLQGSCFHCNRSKGSGSHRRSPSPTATSSAELSFPQQNQQENDNINRSDQPKLVPWIG